MGNELCLAMTLVSNSTACYVDTIIFTCHVLLITDEFCIWQLLRAHIATDEISLICREKVFTFRKSVAAVALRLSLGASSVPHCLREYGGSGWGEQWEQSGWYTLPHKHGHRSYSIHHMLNTYLFIGLSLVYMCLCVCARIHIPLWLNSEASWAQ